MCISDWRLGRLIRSAISTGAFTSGQILSVPSSMQRVGVILASNGIAIAVGSSSIITIDGKNWGILDVTNSPITLLMKDCGDLPTKSISLTCGTTAQQLIITELFLPESVINENLDDLMQT